MAAKTQLTRSTTVERTIAPLGTLPALILLALGIPTLILGSVRAVQVQRSISPLRVADGVVTADEVRRLPDPEGSRSPVRSYFVIVEFVTTGGQSQRFTEVIGNSSAEYSEGDSVEVLYDPEEPSRAFLNSWKNTWQEPVIYIVLGLLPIVTLLVWRAWTLSLTGR